MDNISKYLIGVIVLVVLLGIYLTVSYKKNFWPYSKDKTDKENKKMATTISIVLGVVLALCGGYLGYHLYNV